MINGPINAVELEGKINGVKKKILFMLDVHAPITHQTECNDIHAKDVRTYLLDLFEKNSTVTFDFFFETTPYVLRSRTNEYDKGIYIYNVQKLFKKLYYNNEYSNVRLHYVDIRHIIPMTYKNNDDNDDIVHQLTYYAYYLIKIYDLLYNKNKNDDIKKEKKVKKKPTIMFKYPKFKKKKVAHILNKLKHKYSNTDVMKKINEYINSELKDFILFLMEEIKSVLELIPEPYNSIIFVEKPSAEYELLNLNRMGFNNKLESISMHFMYLRSFLTDIYLLRRFLDKKYITTTISYNGGFHSVHCMYVLIKYFDFKIIKQAYGKFNGIKKNLKLKNIMTELGKDFFPKLPVQCCNMEGFLK